MFFSKQRHIGVANHIHIYPFQKTYHMLWTVLNPRGVIIFQVSPSLRVPFGFWGPGFTNLAWRHWPQDLQCQHFPLAFFAKLRNRQLLIFDFIGWHVWLVSNLKSEKEPKLPNWFCFWCRCFFVGLVIQKAAAKFLGDLGAFSRLSGRWGMMGVSNWRTQFHLVRVYTPLKFNMNLKISPWKFGDSELGNHHFFRFQPFNFGGCSLHWLTVVTYPYNPWDWYTCLYMNGWFIW